jgi:sialidase-1
MSPNQRWSDPRCTDLDMPYGGRFIELSDGRLFTVQNNTTLYSSDDGKTWEDGGPVYTGRKPGVPGSGPMIKTEDGVIVMLFADMSTFRSSSRGWIDAAGRAADDVRLDVWSVRSLDEGQTWQDRHRVLEGYCGAMINMIQMSRNGPIVAPIQDLWYDPDRNVQPVFTSGDNGKSWTKSNVIDLGGHGHHDGAMESIVIELNDRRVWMLIRTNWDYFWEAYSMDEGLSWRIIQPTDIDASSAPGYILRLASGRMVLVWNRLYPEGSTSYQRRAGAYSNVPGSWHREELSIAFSEDDGNSWTDPVVLAKEETGLSYPYIFERRPGELWITTGFQGALQVSIKEEEWV